MRTKIEITEEDLKTLVVNHIEEIFNIDVSKTDVKILVKTSMNYKAEWEVGGYKAEVNMEI